MNPDNIAFADHTECLLKAHSDREALEATLNDNYYPKFHLAAPAGWINDPNGLCQYQGKTHVFFQHNPQEPIWGPMHWGHLTSTDLLTWTHEPIALAPSIEADRSGCWSGSAMVGADGKLYLIYTGHRWLPDQGMRAQLEVQCLATSTDGITFEKHGVIVPNPEHLHSFRDPKVFRYDGRYYMVVGQQSKDNRGQIRLLTSVDLIDWSDAGVIYEYPDEHVFMLECPDLFELDGQWVLVFSAMGLEMDGYLIRHRNTAGYVVGDWSPDAPFKARSAFRPVDFGHNYYAPQSYVSEDGRRLQMGWMRPSGKVSPEMAHGWCGQLTVARELSLKDDVLCQRPARELDGLFDASLHLSSVKLAADETMTVVPDLDCGRVRVTFDLAASTAERFGLQIGASQTNRPLFVGYDALKGWVICDRMGAAIGPKGLRGAPVTGSSLSLDILIDRGCVEVFTNAGTVVFSEDFYPTEGAQRALMLSSEAGDALVRDLIVETLKPKAL